MHASVPSALPAAGAPAVLSPLGLLDEILRSGRLSALFQPVVDLTNTRVYGYESLIRGPVDSEFHMPEALFGEARRRGVHPLVEHASATSGMRSFQDTEAPAGSNLFLNMSASALLHFWMQWGESMPARLLDGCALDPGRIIIELTEHDPAFPDMRVLTRILRALRAHGMRLALDDYGVGHGSLQLWSEAQPDLVKIDRYFFHGIAQDERRQKLVRAVLSVAQCLGTPTIAAGVETAEDLAVVRDLGIRYAQGWFLGYPAARPHGDVAPQVRQVLEQRAPARGAARVPGATAATLRVQAPSVSPSRHTNDDVHRLFDEHKSLHAVAVVDDDNRPLGIINRRDFTDRYAQRYTRELFGRDGCTTFMNGEPVLVDVHASIDQLSHVLVSDDQRYLVDGFIITRDGNYDGLGTGEALVRSVTEMRIEAARYANPLTSLPGNIPISQHIGSLLEGGVEFVTGYCDLNHFKPFNDVYGYWRGDDMIQLCATVIRNHCDPQRDFVGHVGGDDFVILFRSADWRERAERIIHDFNRNAIDLYDDEGRARGGIEAEDRYGVMRSFPFVTLSIGALYVSPQSGVRIRPEDIASAAARVKHQVKHGDVPLVVEPYLAPGG
ncbi:GGDEF domain-containing protein [Bordetella genomosp. 8]|uniref:GGDEF domain-containing protein n=1 Tax=Bordetella genomosp. 8 TaxID=1416806 RepID=A0A1W6YLY9_9BORD|nr:EAL domain-containing protein [Bordetella genomosp. 8]ARP82051.1 GGDEF domain-containing protein [Bordetella genomosp. 8]